MHQLGVRLLFLALDLKPEEDHAECIHVRELVHNFADLGHEVLLLTSRESTWSPNGRNGQVAIRHVGGGRTVEEVRRVLREAKRFEPDVIYERRFLPKISAAVSALTAVPAIVEINGLVEDEMKMQGKNRSSAVPHQLKGHAYSQVFAQMRAVVTVTAGLATEMSRLFGVPDSRLTVIENAANTRLFRPLDKLESRRQLEIDWESQWIGFVGGLLQWHGVDTVLRALPHVNGAPPVKLLVVGDGPCRAELEALAISLDLADRVRFVGQVPYEDVARYISACDICVGPFTRERNERIGGSPMKVYEYVACGRPVVISRLAGVGDWVERERLGLLAEPDSPHEFAEKMTQVLNDAAWLEAMKTRGPEAVAREHEWRGVARKITELCHAVVKEMR